jgi:hypothetical protein
MCESKLAARGDFGFTRDGHPKMVKRTVCRQYKWIFDKVAYGYIGYQHAALALPGSTGESEIPNSPIH